MSLGSIVIDLLMRTGAFETDAKRAAGIADKRAKEIDASFKKAGKAIGIALAGAATTAAVAIGASINRMDEMSKSAQKVGMATEDFSRLAHAADLSDVGMEALVSTMGRLARSQAAALNPASKQAKIFKELNIEVQNLDGSLRSGKDVLADFADKVKESGVTPEVIAAGMQVFGKSFQEMIPLLLQGSEGMKDAATEADELGLTLSTKAGLQAEEFNDNMTRLKGAVMGATMEIASGMLPALEGLTGSLVDGAREGGNFAEIGVNIATAFGFVADVVSVVVRAVQSLSIVAANAVGQLSDFYDIGKQIVTLGFADGTIKQSWDSASRGRQTARDMLGETWSAPLPSKMMGGQAPPLLARPGNADDWTDALEAAMKKGGKKGGGKAKKAELTEEQKAAEALTKAYEQQLETLREREYLLENTGELAKLEYDLTLGALKDLDGPRKEELRAIASSNLAIEERNKLLEDGESLTDAMKTETERNAEAIAEATKLYDAAAISLETLNRVMEANKSPAQQMLEDLAEEARLLTMTNEQRETYNALKAAGVDANSAEGASIASFVGQLQETREATAMMDELRGSTQDFFKEIASGSVSALDAMKHFFDSLANMLLEWASKGIMQQLLGQPGQAGGGMFGNLFQSIFGSLFGGASGASSFGIPLPGSGLLPGFAGGGDPPVGQPYIVGEHGPEVRMDRVPSTIIPMNKLRGGGLTQVFNNRYAAPNDPRTIHQQAARTGYEARRATERSGA